MWKQHKAFPVFVGQKQFAVMAGILMVIIIALQ